MQPLETSGLSEQQVTSWAFDTLAEANQWVVRELRKMKFPRPSGVGVPAEALDAPSPHTPSLAAVRQVLVKDEDLHAEITVAAVEALRQRALRAPIREEELRPYFYVVVRRLTRRRAVRRARWETAVTHYGERNEGVDAVSSLAPLLDLELVTRDQLACLGGVLRSLTASDRDLLLASAEGDYEAVARALGISKKTARNRAYELRKVVRARLLS